ncbi:hypothetical protein PN4B1_23810 [Paenibacillus naphthalenovorans]|nr:hypothetical protein PN4B1_23810 [Paenibacillus naphthalenovorans]
MRGEGSPWKSFSRTEDDDGREGSDAGEDVNYGASRKIEAAQFGQPASTPNPVGHRRVHEGCPGGGKQDPDGETDSFGDSARNQSNSNGCKQGLENSEKYMGNRECSERLLAYAGKAQVIHTANDSKKIRSEGKGVTPKDPNDADHDQAAHIKHKDGKNVLPADHSSIEQGETGDEHKQNDSRRDQKPGGVAGVNLWHSGVCGEGAEREYETQHGQQAETEQNESRFR